MNRKLLILLNIVGWTAIIAYLVAASNYTSSKQGGVVCEKINVEVRDGQKRRFITQEMVRAWLSSGEMKVLGREISQINTREVEQFIARRGYVKSVRVYTTIDGAINIELVQRVPVVRFNTANGYNFYLTEDNYVVPAQKHAVEYVPLVTGNFEFPFQKGYIGYLEGSGDENEKKVAKSYEFFSNLIKFVSFVRDNDYWAAFIVQINVRQGDSGQGQWVEPQVEIVPRIGNHIVNIGTLEGYKQKLELLTEFYNGAAAYQGWDRYSYINLNYKGQVVCTK